MMQDVRRQLHAVASSSDDVAGEPVRSTVVLDVGHGAHLAYSSALAHVTERAREVIRSAGRGAARRPRPVAEEIGEVRWRTLAALRPLDPDRERVADDPFEQVLDRLQLAVMFAVGRVEDFI